jgi:hypothetical protein
MPLPEDIRSLADEILRRLRESHDFYVHTRQAWRVVQQLALTGHPVGLVDTASGQDLPSPDLDPMAQRYVAVHLPESVFKGLSGLLEDWVLGLIRLWLQSHPEDLDLDYDSSTGQTRKKKQDEVRIPLSQILRLPNRDAILSVEIERVVRDLTYERPDKWFRYLDWRLSLGCPAEGQKSALYEIKAARDVMEHNRGVVNRDYFSKAGAAARYSEGDPVQVDEPYLVHSFKLLGVVVDDMAAAAGRIASGQAPTRPPRRNRRRR